MRRWTLILSMAQHPDRASTASERAERENYINNIYCRQQHGGLLQSSSYVIHLWSCCRKIRMVVLKKKHTAFLGKKLRIKSNQDGKCESSKTTIRVSRS